MNCTAIHHSRHAFERMFERAIPPGVILKIIAKGEIIGDYPEDHPYPNVLIL